MRNHLIFYHCVASMLCFLAWNWVLKKLGAMVATNYVYLNPVTTIVFAWAILHEQITIYFIAGTLLILTGMYLADKSSSISSPSAAKESSKQHHHVAR